MCRRADVYASPEFHDERTMRFFPGCALKWEDDAAGLLPAQEAFGRERRQRRELFFRVLRKRDLRLFSLLGMEMTLFA